MKTILVPTDFSKNADSALNYAIGIALQENASIILLHAWGVIFPASDLPEIQETEHFSLKKLKELCETAEEFRIPCEFISKNASVVDTILEIANTRKADLIVMGNSGDGGLKEVIFGSIAAKVIQKAKCPVIAVPQKAVFKGLHKITYATNYLKNDFKSLEGVTALARHFGARITLLHVEYENHSAEGAKIILRAFSDKVREKVHYDNISFKLIFGKDAEEALIKYVEEKHADLFVVSSLHRNFFDRLLAPSVADALAYQSKMPLMVFHHTETEVVFN
jgi:nucleotide-binding universal stress UspA family protein